MVYRRKLTMSKDMLREWNLKSNFKKIKIMLLKKGGKLKSGEDVVRVDKIEIIDQFNY
jgi:hypothetical protein